MRFIKEIPDLDELASEYTLNEGQKQQRAQVINEIQDILDGTDKRKLIIIGPCSADREDSVLDYMTRLVDLQTKVKDRFLLVPRIYTSKPRTNSLGYKGLLHRPNPGAENDNLLQGLIATRRMHYRIISETGMFGADEMLYPDVFYYYMDLVCYAAIGARSVEDQQHRIVASGLDTPVGMKNPTSGDMKVMLNAVSAAKHANSTIFHGWIVETEGNKYAHAILRGFEDIYGNMHPNYHYEDVCKLYDMFQSANIGKVAVIIDCNHSNSGKHYDEQTRIAEDVVVSCKKNKIIKGFVKGLMIESYLEDGNQMVGRGVYGKSITDSCLGWNKTEKLILKLAEE